MPDLLVRDIDPQTYDRLKQTAKEQRKSLSQTARDMLAEKVKPSKEEVWAAADRLRRKIGKISGDSTADIRELRDNTERHR